MNRNLRQRSAIAFLTLFCGAAEPPKAGVQPSPQPADPVASCIKQGQAVRDSAKSQGDKPLMMLYQRVSQTTLMAGDYRLSQASNVSGSTIYYPGRLGDDVIKGKCMVDAKASTNELHAMANALNGIPSGMGSRVAYKLPNASAIVQQTLTFMPVQPVRPPPMPAR
jgi:hypothetical protein